MRRIVVLFIGLCLAAVAPPSRADLVLHNNDGSQELRLYESRCTHARTLAYIGPDHRTTFKNARILDRKGFIEAYACWIEAEPGIAFVWFEDGQSTHFDLSKFKDPVI
jgi:hypothetical protein